MEAPAGLVEQVRAAGLTRDAFVLGGPKTIRALFHVGGIDLFGIVVLPVVFGEGIPLFDVNPTSLSSDAWAGAIELVYRTG